MVLVVSSNTGSSCETHPEDRARKREGDEDNVARFELMVYLSLASIQDCCRASPRRTLAYILFIAMPSAQP